MPVNLYQIQVKFRDEIRPRYGILRAREFVMKDAYSFSSNEEELNEIYVKMYDCYSNILKRLGLKFFAVEADTGLIGGKFSHEFIILASNGEDRIAYCPNCHYSANYEMAGFAPAGIEKTEKSVPGDSQSGSGSVLLQVHTPDAATIKSLSDFLKVKPEKIIKTMVLENSGSLFAVLLRGDRELNTAKVEKFIGMPLNLVEHSDKKSNLIMGFIGPSGLDASVKILADNSLKGCMDMVIGANKKDYHFTGANIGRDFEVGHWGDFSFPEEGDLCFKCGKPLEFEKGIEIGHIFKLGTRYSQKMNAVFLDSNGNLKPIIMGCYGIGVSRIISAAIEQLSDDRGIVWPVSIAPFTVNLIAINVEDPRVKNSADSIYEEMKNNGIEVIYDDRNVRAGVKFKDSDLLGIPIKLIVGKKYAENKKVEIELRKSGEKFELDLASALNFISGYSGKNLF